MDSWISYVADILSSFYNESLWSFCSFIENMTLRSLTANTETSIVKQLTLMLSSATTYLHPLAVVTQRASLKKTTKKTATTTYIWSHMEKNLHIT